MSYIHEDPDWPRFCWRDAELAQQLAAVRHRQGRLSGRMEALGFSMRSEAMLQTLTEDVLKSSEIEGELLDKAQVRSSLARRLGLEVAGLIPADRQVEGMVEMMLDATQHFSQPLTEARLYAWHAALFPTGRSGMLAITVGAWRPDNSGPMQVVSGAIGRERIHFEAPAAARLNAEVAGFLAWFENENALDPVLKAALAHLWFITIHPFDDGNGRIARAIADLALARSEHGAERFYSMSAQIRLERAAYYEQLEKTQKGTLDVTEWLAWFFGCLDRALAKADVVLAAVLRQAQYWQLHNQPVNDRQRAMIVRLFNGFEGKLTTSKWAKLGKCSQDTALREIADLLERGMLVKNPGGGRSTSYALADSSSP